MNIGFFGITANPPHAGHVDAAVQALAFVDEVWVSVAYSHAFNKPNLISYEHRAQLTELVFENMLWGELGQRVKIKELDKQYFEHTQIAPVYTYNLMKWLESSYAQHEFTIFFGSDVQQNLPKYYKATQLIAQWPVRFLTQNSAYHSSDVRALLGGFSAQQTQGPQPQLQDPRLLQLLGPRALNYIVDHGLYRAV